MRVLHIINSLKFGGAESLLTELLPSMNKEIEVCLLVLDFDPKDQFAVKLQNSGINIIPLKIVGGIYNPILVLKIRPIISQFQYVHVHLFPSLYWVALASSFNNQSCKLIFTEHSTNNKRREKFIFKVLDKFIYKYYSRIICISDATKENLSNHLDSDRGLIKIENGVNLSTFSNALPILKNSFGFNDEDIVVLQVASFRAAKDQDTVIRALNLLPDKVKLIFAGEGDRIELCRNLVVQYNVSDRVKFLGNRNDIPNLLAMCDIVVMSSNYEGFGLAAVEGMASGKPVIASNVEGLSQVVGNAGLLFDKGSEEMLVLQIEALIKDESYYNQIKLNCRLRAEEYSINQTVAKYINVYREINTN